MLKIKVYNQQKQLLCIKVRLNWTAALSLFSNKGFNGLYSLLPGVWLAFVGKIVLPFSPDETKHIVLALFWFCLSWLRPSSSVFLQGQLRI